MTTLTVLNLIKYGMIDFRLLDLLPYHAFPTTSDPSNFGTGKMLKTVNSDLFVFQCSFKGGNENIIKNSISFHTHFTANVCQPWPDQHNWLCDFECLIICSDYLTI